MIITDFQVLFELNKNFNKLSAYIPIINTDLPSEIVLAALRRFLGSNEHIV